MSQSQFVSQCTADALQLAATSLRDGNLVAFPTETVYGLGADALNKQAVARVYQVKGRPADHPLIVHIHSMQVMGQWVDDVPEYGIIRTLESYSDFEPVDPLSVDDIEFWMQKLW